MSPSLKGPFLAFIATLKRRISRLSRNIFKKNGKSNELVPKLERNGN
jgi:hypothetical protein